ncbi:metal-binding protein ZinT [Morganella morganii]|nr:metal-binding protein ZinT [Morganella morganii]
MILRNVRNYTLALLSVLFFAGFSAVSVAHTENENLADWKGNWVSAVSLLNTPAMDSELQVTYEKLGKRDGMTAQEWKEKKLSKWNTAIREVSINDDTITFTLGDGSQVSGKYTYAGSSTTIYGEHQLSWNKFTTEDEGVWHNIMLMKPEISEDTTMLTHFHFRYGNDGFEPLLNAGVFPTMVAPETTAAQFAADFAE